ncbi:MAG: hypothetical protein CSA68_07510 [Rhodobacterales bacterium]|nr:MAG: hypothetical protein CSA68_07510 [Rhodobacterales bacterium]
MFKILRRIILGGRSDKREAAWFVFFLINMVLAWAVWQESSGVDMPQTWAFLVVSWPVALTAVIGVHVQHFHAQALADRALAKFGEGAGYDVGGD